VSDKSSCQCEICKRGCEFKPGWFMPGQIELSAADLGISPKQFFDKYLGIDWWVADDDIYVFAPATTEMKTGQEYPGDPRGCCVFYVDELCTIHSTKPFECAETIHSEKANGLHEAVANAWKLHQEQIKELLGREPESSAFGLFDMLGLYRGE